MQWGSQGSLISPILFNIYIKDLIIEIKNISFVIIAYADDLCFYFKIEIN